MNGNQLLGTIFMVASGLIYALERGFSVLSTSLIRAGFFSGQMTGEIPTVLINSFFSNLFIPGFLILGTVLLISGFYQQKDK
jgi:hypothetical protein